MSSQVTTDATCDTDGVRTYTCSGCSYSYTETISATGHTWSDATCTTAKTCSVCGATDGNANGHTPAAAVKENEVAATCTKEGSYDSVVYCSVCKEQISRTTVNVSKAAHTEVEIPAVPATCTSTGLTAGKECSVCGTVTVNQQETPKVAHTEVEIPAVPATCTSTGLTAGKKCSVCGTVTVNQQETEMLDHSYGAWTMFDATTHRRTCNNCTAFESGSHAYTADVQPMASSSSFHDYLCETCNTRGAKVNGVDTFGVGEACTFEKTSDYKAPT